MAGSGKSQKGRGGISGGMGSSSGRASSHTSNSSTPTSNRRPLPIQYAHSQSPIPETIPPRGSTLAPQASPRGSASHPQPIRPQPLRPPPYVPPQWTPPPYNPPPEGPETDAEPMEDQFPEQAQPPPHQDPPMSIHDLLQTPGRTDYLPILDPLPTANTIWFDRDDGKLVRKISKILKSKFDGPYYCWTKTPPYVQDRCFIAFAHTIGIPWSIHSWKTNSRHCIESDERHGLQSKDKTGSTKLDWGNIVGEYVRLLVHRGGQSEKFYCIKCNQISERWTWQAHTSAKFGGANSSSIELGVKTRKVVFWSILEHMGRGAWRDLAHGSSSTGYAKEEGRSHLEDQLDRLLDQPVEFLNSTGQASTRSS
ncbi:unnamed protein product [Microthlaspi erraticum]|uniref:Uncharacterized protein n=1 Tax=Microthlaspi erraticum TaxID=1685480 RepID=A0A6D2JAC4_9BRAS|nr:unnamed protein product [Microthlaspi erraticum]